TQSAGGVGATGGISGYSLSGGFGIGGDYAGTLGGSAGGGGYYGGGSGHWGGAGGGGSSYIDGIFTNAVTIEFGQPSFVSNPDVSGNGFVAITSLAPPVPNDAGVASITPLGNFCSGVQNIQSTIQNFGLNQINSVNVSWSVNNVLQGTINHNTVLDTGNGLGAFTALINLGNYNFSQSIPYTIKVWTY